jgi:membrane associated rhomboid family serine protease
MFMHGSWEHIIFNMFTLWMFGRFIEMDLGSRRFFVYYMVCGVGAGLIQMLVCWLTNAPLDVPTVGASGAIYGLLLAFAMLHPNDIIMPLIPPIPMKAKWAVLVFCAIELLLGIRGSFFSSDNVAHFAHLGGALFGFVLLWWWLKTKKIYRYS